MRNQNPVFLWYVFSAPATPAAASLLNFVSGLFGCCNVLAILIAPEVYIADIVFTFLSWLSLLLELKDNLPCLREFNSFCSRWCLASNDLLGKSLLLSAIGLAQLGHAPGRNIIPSAVTVAIVCVAYFYEITRRWGGSSLVNSASFFQSLSNSEIV
eukprot:GHVO01036052.1.p1 GENE.GHVO01036052.1~~GHVO01036052.1.p1  ORF type:complete len:156 (+),score=7.79 GHVO01036052.1:181-648(+)